MGPFAGGGLNATPNDLARFAVMMLNDDQFKADHIGFSAQERKMGQANNSTASTGKSLRLWAASRSST
jgi:CubicO group peptidase (beta-lactamase class C family)